MASHESYYTSANSVSTPLPTQSPNNTGAPPPPPPPKSHDPSRAGTPAIPPIPPHPNAIANQLQNLSSPAGGLPSLPQTPASPAHQGQYQYQYPNQQVGPPPQQPDVQTFQQAQQHQKPSVTAPPLDSGWLPEGLKDHTTADLQRLVNDSELLDAFAKQHPAYNAALEPLQAAISTNLALAQHVAQLESQVKQLRDQTGQLLLNHTSLQTQWRRKQSEMDDALSSWGPRAMYSRLVSSVNEQEALLRAVHESFVEGGAESHEYYGTGGGKATEKEVTEWIKRIREGTTTLEKRREMRQRWDEGRVGGWR